MRTYIWETDESDEYAVAGVIAVVARNLRTARTALLKHAARMARKTYPGYAMFRRIRYPDSVRPISNFVQDQLMLVKMSEWFPKKPMILKSNTVVTFNTSRLGERGTWL